MIRKNSGPVSQKIEQDLLIGELAAPALEHLNVLLGDTFNSLFHNQKNIDTWPDVVVQDVLRHFQRLNGATHVISGQAKVILLLL